jgi:putative DNA primase/helicase
VTAHNGKSIIIFLMHKTFNFNGGNISAVSPQKLANNTFAGSSIHGKMANIVDDQPDQVIEDSGTLKTMITGGYVEIEGKGKDSKAVEMSGTAFITASNHYPNFREHGNQINRRLHIIPFEHNFSQDPECLSDLEAMARLSTESAREYCLKLAVEAVKRMLTSASIDRLTVNKKAIEAGLDFAVHSDPLADYYDEFTKEYLLEITGQRAIQEYHDWCDRNFIKKYKRLETPDFKKTVCKYYDLEWRNKMVKLNGSWKSDRGFAKPKKV